MEHLRQQWQQQMAHTRAHTHAQHTQAHWAQAPPPPLAPYLARARQPCKVGDLVYERRHHDDVLARATAPTSCCRPHAHAHAPLPTALLCRSLLWLIVQVVGEPRALERVPQAVRGCWLATAGEGVAPRGSAAPGHQRALLEGSRLCVRACACVREEEKGA